MSVEIKARKKVIGDLRGWLRRKAIESVVPMKVAKKEEEMELPEHDGSDDSDEDRVANLLATLKDE